MAELLSSPDPQRISETVTEPATETATVTETEAEAGPGVGADVAAGPVDVVDGITLHLLRWPDHAAALFDFERANRAYFAASIPDRGDDYFTDFEGRHRLLLAEQEAGICYFHLLLTASGVVAGRMNLVDLADGEAELGYRIAASAAGRGLATAAVRRTCALAATRYGLTRLNARTTLDNAGSRTVLERAGFAVVGEISLSGKPGLSYVRELGPGMGESAPGGPAPGGPAPTRSS